MYDFEAFPPKGGNHVHALELTQGFIKNGHSVSVVNDSTMPNAHSFTDSQEDLKLFMQSIEILYVRIDARDTRRWTALSECTRIASITSKKIPIVWEINAPANETLAYSWLSGKSLKKKEGVLTYLRRWVHATRKIPGIYFEERHRRHISKNVSTAICVSKAIGAYAEEVLAIKDILVLPNGGPIISEDEINKRKALRNDDAFTVLYSGSAMYPWQGLNFLSQVIDLANKRSSGIKFVLAVNQKKDDLPCSDNVVVVEHLNREQIFDAICAADACVSLHPEYPWTKYSFHNSPMKLFEYMACMTPAVASNIGQMRDILNHRNDAMLCENTPEDILDKLIFLKENTDQAKGIGRAGWDRIQTEFNWGINVKKTLLVFEKAMEVNK